jgi:transketolase
VRAAFVRTLCELAAADERLVLLTGDLGFMVLEPFRDTFPDRFFNVGVAEQNMVGLATGLAEAGFIPFCYSIGTFASLRPFEFIRNGPALHRLPVRVIGLGAGFEYASSGPTHYSLEDIGVMRTQPGIELVAPADFEQARQALLATWNRAGPIYYRLGKDDHAKMPGLFGRFTVGRTQTVREGDDLLIFACGPISLEAAQAADDLARDGIQASIVVVASLRPLPDNDIAEALRHHMYAITVETHYVTGGLGSVVAEVIADRGLSTHLLRLGVRSQVDLRSGSAAYLHSRYGIDHPAIVMAARQLLEGARVRGA